MTLSSFDVWRAREVITGARPSSAADIGGLRFALRRKAIDYFRGRYVQSIMTIMLLLWGLLYFHSSEYLSRIDETTHYDYGKEGTAMYCKLHYTCLKHINIS